MSSRSEQKIEARARRLAEEAAYREEARRARAARLFALGCLFIVLGIILIILAVS